MSEDCATCGGKRFILPEPTGDFLHDLTGMPCPDCEPEPMGPDPVGQVMAEWAEEMAAGRTLEELIEEANQALAQRFPECNVKLELRERCGTRWYLEEVE